MQVGSITCISQRFALTRCHCSSQERKPRHRKSKEERRAMVETFVTNFRNTNNGSFPSLKLTHKEVGGSYYIVRDIMRDIIQENRVLGPGDLNMHSLTLEDVPLQPEICEDANTRTSAELHLEAGSEEDCIVVESVNQGSNVALDVLEDNLFENEDQVLHSSNGKSFEQMQVLNYEKGNSKLVAEENCTDNAVKRPIDVSENNFHKNEDVQGSVVSIITEKMDEPEIDTKVGEADEVSENDVPLTYDEAIMVDSNIGPRETSKSEEDIEGSMAVENGHIRESIMEVREKNVTNSKSDSDELKGEVLESADIFSVNKSEKLDSSVELMDLDVKKDLKEESAGDMAAEANSEITKDERGQSSENHGKMSLDENMKSTPLIGTVETRGSNGDLQMGTAVDSSVELMDSDVKKDLKEESAGDMAAEAIGKINSEIKKDERGQSSEINSKISLDENKKSTSLTGTVETWDSNGGLEMGRTAVEVEQFPLPRANSSLNSEDHDCVFASAGVDKRELELVEVKAPAAVITKTDTKPELENPNSGKSLDTVPDTEHGATLNDAPKTKRLELTPRTPINEYLLHRHESYLELDFLTREVSMDASSNREGVKKSRARTENNPFWNTVRAFVAAIIKFWSE